MSKVAAAIALTIAVTGGIAVASTSDNGTPPAETHRALAVAAPNTTPLTGYVPVTPCRIVSTLNTGRIAAGGSRSFFAGGVSGFPAQGGASGGCGIPIGASAIAVSVTALGSTASGLFTLYSDGTTRPAARQVSYSTNQTTTTLVNVPINLTTGKLALYTSSASHVLMDVAGYYREPIAVTIAADGTIKSQSGQVSSVTHSSTGEYDIAFNENTEQCAVQATTLGSNYNAAVTITGSNTLAVYTRALDKSTTSTVYGDALIYVTVTC